MNLNTTPHIQSMIYIYIQTHTDRYTHPHTFNIYKICMFHI